jgi:hypothetical protein
VLLINAAGALKDFALVVMNNPGVVWSSVGLARQSSSLKAAGSCQLLAAAVQLTELSSMCARNVVGPTGNVEEHTLKSVCLFSLALFVHGPMHCLCLDLAWNAFQAGTHSSSLLCMVVTAVVTAGHSCSTQCARPKNASIAISELPAQPLGPSCQSCVSRVKLFRKHNHHGQHGAVAGPTTGQYAVHNGRHGVHMLCFACLTFVCHYNLSPLHLTLQDCQHQCSLSYGQSWQETSLALAVVQPCLTSTHRQLPCWAKQVDKQGPPTTSR